MSGEFWFCVSVLSLLGLLPQPIFPLLSALRFFKFCLQNLSLDIVILTLWFSLVTSTLSHVQNLWKSISFFTMLLSWTILTTHQFHFSLLLFYLHDGGQKPQNQAMQNKQTNLSKFNLAWPWVILQVLYFLS